MRTSSAQIEREALEDLASRLRAAGYRTRREAAAEDGRADLIIESDEGARLIVEVKARAVASTLPESWLRKGVDADWLIVVADVVTETARSQLREAGSGWLDRRGHMHLPPDQDLDVTPCPRTSGSDGDPIAGRASMEVALAALISPGEPPGVRELSRAVGLAPSTISVARSSLIDALLLTSDGRPVRPNLFNAVSAQWQPQWRPLADDPPGGLHGVDMVISGDVGAVLNGAPMAVGSATPTHYYVESQADFRTVLRTLGPGSVLEPKGWVAVSPARYAMLAATHRESMAAPGISGQVVPPAVSAVELAGDLARGREILDAWELPEAPWKA